MRADHEGVSSHGCGGKGLIADVVASVVVAARYGLESVAVEMEGVFAGVVVVDDDIDNVVLFQDEGVCVGAVDVGVCCRRSGCESCVQGRYLGRYVGDVVKEGVISPVAEIVHRDCQRNSVVRLREKSDPVFGNKSKVVEGVKAVNESWGGEVRCVVIINQIACHIPVQ